MKHEYKKYASVWEPNWVIWEDVAKGRPQSCLGVSETIVSVWKGGDQTAEELCGFLFKSVFNFILPFQEMKTGNHRQCIKGVFYTRKMAEKRHWLCIKKVCVMFVWWDMCVCGGICVVRVCVCWWWCVCVAECMWWGVCICWWWWWCVCGGMCVVGCVCVWCCW